MTDEEILKRAIAGIEEMRRGQTLKETEEQRKQRLIKIVMEQTGADFLDASRYIAYAMMPQTTSGDIG